MAFPSSSGVERAVIRQDSLYGAFSDIRGHLGQMCFLLCALVFSSAKWKQYYCFFYRVHGRDCIKQHPGCPVHKCSWLLLWL